MSVYVDDYYAPYGRMLMCHLIADSQKELLNMVMKLNINIIHIQNKNTYREHFDICKSKRKLAIEYGAIPITVRELGEILRQRIKVQSGEHK